MAPAWNAELPSSVEMRVLLRTGRNTWVGVVLPVRTLNA